MHGRSERVESPGTSFTERVSHCHYCLDLCSVRPLSRALVVITWRGWVAVTLCGWDKLKRVQILNITVQMSCVWAKGCMLMFIFLLSDFT